MTEIRRELELGERVHFLSAGRRVRLVASFSEYVESLFIRIEARMHAFVDEWMNSLRVIWGADLTPRGRVIIQNLNIISARSKITRIVRNGLGL